MKKNYLAPEMEVVNMTTMQMLAASGDGTMEVSTDKTYTMDASEFQDNGGSEDW